eukprot:1365783-Pleurochrysis_carterae.AAC.1
MVDEIGACLRKPAKGELRSQIVDWQSWPTHGCRALVVVWMHVSIVDAATARSQVDRKLRAVLGNGQVLERRSMWKLVDVGGVVQWVRLAATEAGSLNLANNAAVLFEQFDVDQAPRRHARTYTLTRAH